MSKKTDRAWAADAVERWPLERLKPYERNPRKHSAEQVAQIAASMREWGWTMPVLAADDGRVIAGHGRLLAAARLGFREAPVLVARGWSDAQIRAYVIADNQLALNASWDQELLGAEIADLLPSFDLGLVGFSDEQLAGFLHPALPEGQTDPDELPEVELAPVSQRGDLWILGEHRLLCADSTEGRYLLLACDSALVDAVWTDPPYNVAYEGKSGQGSIANDSMSAAAFSRFLHEAFLAIAEVMRPGAPIYVAHADSEGLVFRRAFTASGFKLSGCLVWVKNAITLSRSDYQWQHEPVLYGWRPGGRHRWYGGRKQTTVQEVAGEAFAMNPDGSVTVRCGNDVVVVRGENLQVEAVESTVLRFKKPHRATGHPTVKPVELVTRMLANSTRPNDTVLDAFGGSGTTLIACEQLGRRARLVELEPRFVDLTIRRWQNFTGKDAVLAGTKRTFSEVTTGGRK